MLLAIDRVSKSPHVAFFDAATKMSGAAFLREVTAVFPYAIHTVLTDNGMAFADLPKNRAGPPRRWLGPHIFDRVCRAHGIGHRLTKPYQPVDEVVVSSGRWSKAILKTIRAGMALWATRTVMRASYAPLLVGSRTKKHQPPATASFGVPAPMSRRMSSPRLCPATWIR